VVFACLSAGSAQAAPVFSDNFNSENGGVGALNYTGFLNFGISGGTVDLIGNGFFDFFPANGLYVDLDGSSYQAGLMSANPLDLGAGDYTLSFDLAGSQRGDTNAVTVNVFSSAHGTYASHLYTLGSSDPFSTDQIGFTLSGSDSVQFSFQNAGGDNVGALLDNVEVDQTGSPVPEPTSMLLLGTGLVGIIRRRLTTA
jgi:PEP-CTERM motif